MRFWPVILSQGTSADRHLIMNNQKESKKRATSLDVFGSVAVGTSSPWRDLRKSPTQSLVIRYKSLLTDRNYDGSPQGRRHFVQVDLQVHLSLFDPWRCELD